MKKRIGLIAATAVAALIPLAAAGTASASGEFHVSGAYATSAACNAAGVAGHDLWGPNFFCTYNDGLYFLMTH